MLRGFATAGVLCASISLAACTGPGGGISASEEAGSPYRFPSPPAFEEIGKQAGLRETQLHLTGVTDTAGRAARDQRCEDVVDKLRDITNARDIPGISYDLRHVCSVDRMAGGVAAYDLVGDSLPDIVLTRLGAHPLLYRNDSRLHGSTRFTDVSDESGFSTVDVDTDGVAIADIDNDGDADVFMTVLHAGSALLLVNDGSGRFSEEAEARGVSMNTGTGHFGGSATFGDYDGDGWPDLHVSEWVPAHTSPTILPAHTRLFRNEGSTGTPGVFVDVTEEAGVSMQRPNFPVVAMSSLFHDFDSDGHVDLLVVSDFGTTRWFWSNGDGTFTNKDSTGRFKEQAGMGVAMSDTDGDGSPEIYITSIHAKQECPLYAGLANVAYKASFAATVGHTGSRLFTLDGYRSLRDISTRAGVREVYWGWGASFGDFRNSGAEDLVAVGGMYRGNDECYVAETPHLWVNDGFGNFLERTDATGMNVPLTAKAVAVLDADGDGLLDMLITRDYDTPLLFRNVSDIPARALRVRVVSDEGVPLPGVKVVVLPDRAARPIVRWSGPLGAYRSVSEPVLHVGVGSLDRVAEVVVEFPGRERIVLSDVDVGRELVVSPSGVRP